MSEDQTNDGLAYDRDQRIADLSLVSEQDETSLGWMDRTPPLLAEIIATDGRLPADAPFYLMVRNAGYGVDDTGVEMGFPHLEEVGCEDIWPALDLVEARAVRILLALAPDLFGGLRSPMSLPPNSCIQLDENVQPALSSHERMIRTEALRDRLVQAGKSEEQIAGMLATPRPVSR